MQYFTKNVYNKIGKSFSQNTDTELYNDALKNDNVTEKESELWKYVLSFYGEDEFSTKQLEKDFGNAAYATIRSFVIKFEELGLLTSQRFGNRVKYKVNI